MILIEVEPETLEAGVLNFVARVCLDQAHRLAPAVVGWAHHKELRLLGQSVVLQLLEDGLWDLHELGADVDKGVKVFLSQEHHIEDRGIHEVTRVVGVCQANAQAFEYPVVLNGVDGYLEEGVGFILLDVAFPSKGYMQLVLKYAWLSC